MIDTAQNQQPDEYSTGAKYTLQLPPVFYDDHVSRRLPAGTEIKRNKNLVTVEANMATIRDIYNDAEYYHWTYKEGGFGPGEYRALAGSAKRTMVRIDNFLEEQE